MRRLQQDATGQIGALDLTGKIPKRLMGEREIGECAWRSSSVRPDRRVESFMGIPRVAEV